MAKLIVGCGYLGERVAAAWSSQGDEVYATTRRPQQTEVWRRQGWNALTADVSDDDSLRALENLPPLKTVLFAIGFDRGGDHSIHEIYVNGLVRTLEHLPSVEKLIYISSTGVYSQNAGEWVNESSPCDPVREGGKACLAAEQALSSSSLGDSAVILRLAGIYGPDRVPRRQDILAGKPITAPSAGYLNLVHVDDAVQVVLAAEEKSTTPRCYVVSDGSPVLRSDYYAEIARQYSAPPPTFAEPDPKSPAAQRSGADKRIDTKRMQEELAVDFMFRNYQQGLAAICANG